MMARFTQIGNGLSSSQKNGKLLETTVQVFFHLCIDVLCIIHGIFAMVSLFAVETTTISRKTNARMVF